MDNKKRIALTIDDLPYVASHVPANTEDGIEIIDMLLGHLQQQDVKVTGFVIGKVADENEKNDLLEKWHSAGHILANHTYSHPRLSAISFGDFEQEVIRNEKLLAPFVANCAEKYFRFPFLDYGSTTEQGSRALGFLYKRSYTVVPVTLDSKDYMFNTYYTQARLNNEAQAMQNNGRNRTIY